MSPNLARVSTSTSPTATTASPRAVVRRRAGRRPTPTSAWIATAPTHQCSPPGSQGAWSTT
eukprot:8829865-Alexandrium_andersonii.AAC.1